MEGGSGTFKRAGFAVLRGKNWTYVLRNTHVIIGRAPTGDTKWLVDLDLGSSRSISRQHALLIYNFEEQHFEMRILSKKAKIKVDGRVYQRLDGAAVLKHHSVVSIHNVSFVFVLPN